MSEPTPRIQPDRFYDRTAIEQNRTVLQHEIPESEDYLERFSGLPPDRFAVIKVGGELINDPVQLESTASGLARLQSLGLYPVVIHGGGPQINERLASSGHVTTQNGGIRTTHLEHMPMIAEALNDVNRLLCQTINDYGGDTESVIGIFAGTTEDPSRLRNVDHITQVDAQAVRAAIAQNKIPVVSCIGHLVIDGRETDQLVNINGDVAAAALAKALAPEKYISLTAIGAVMDTSDGAGRSFSNLTAAAARRLIQEGVIDGGMKIKVSEALGLLDHGVHDLVVASPDHLIPELFSRTGAGTIIHH